MKKIYSLLCLFISSMAFAQAPLLIEDFNYTAGDLLTAHGWTNHSGTANPVLVTSPGLTFAGYVGSNIGLAAGVNNTGYDVNKLFAERTSGSVYASFLVNSAAIPTAGLYFFHFFDPAASTAHRARTFITPLTGKMKVGFSFNASAVQGTASIDYNFGETYLFVVKYSIVAGTTNDVVSLYVFAAGADFSTEPATPTLGPFTATNTTPGDPLTPLGPDIIPTGIALRQNDATQRITIDGFRVKTSWELATDVAPTMTVSTNTLTIAAPANSTNTFNIISNASWTALSDQTWLTVSKVSGYGNETITLTAAENTTTSTQSANVTVTTDGVTQQTILVTQDASTPTGINEISNKGFVVYPNPPSNGLLNISFSGNNNKQIEIFDQTGRRIRVENSSNNTIDVRGLKTGIFILKVKDGNQISTSKFIIK
jgi:hypothetical protein